MGSSVVLAFFFLLEPTEARVLCEERVGRLEDIECRILREIEAVGRWVFGGREWVVEIREGEVGSHGLRKRERERSERERKPKMLNPNSNESDIPCMPLGF